MPISFTVILPPLQLTNVRVVVKEQLLPTTTAVNTPAVVVGNNCSFTTTRTFVNWSGGSITVKEMGIVCYFYSGGNKYMQATRDVFVTPLVVVYGGGVVAEYTLEVEA